MPSPLLRVVPSAAKPTQPWWIGCTSNLCTCPVEELPAEVSNQAHPLHIRVLQDTEGYKLPSELKNPEQELQHSDSWQSPVNDRNSSQERNSLQDRGNSLQDRVSSQNRFSSRAGSALLRAETCKVQEWCQRVLAILTVAFTLVLLLPTFNRGLAHRCTADLSEGLASAGNDHFSAQETALRRRIIYLCASIGAIVTAPIAAVLQARASTRFLRSAAAYTTVVWLAQWSRAANTGLLCAGIDGSASSGFFMVFFFCFPSSNVMACVLIFGRMRALERTLLQPLGCTWMKRLLWAGAALVIAVLPLWTFLSSASGYGFLRKLLGLSIWVLVTDGLVFNMLAVRGLVRVLRSTREVCIHSTGRSREDARRANLTLVVTKWSIVAGTFTMFSSAISTVVVAGYSWPLQQRDLTLVGYVLGIGVSQALDAAVNAFLALVLSGASRVERPHETLRQMRWQRSARRHTTEGHSGWDAKVQELANRGFTLDALLRFYRGLGEEYMDWWDPSRHTTTDVVRGAIIPLSKATQSSLASVMMGNVPTVPEKMVTHNWSNLFRDLVAAIIADALGDYEYGKISYLMTSDFDLLEAWVREKGAIKRTYWVCAFSVNQHAGICGENPSRACDSVTGKIHETCNCDFPKAWSTTEPTLADGRSVPSEMNKFHHMMLLLSASNQAFEQVVAVDANFQLFSRAWCVAEIAAAHTAGMKQLLKIKNASSLRKQEERLRSLRIEDMEASRPEDKADILSNIPNTNAFNARLQSMLFEELFPAWLNLDAVEQMQHIARIARWGATSRARGSTGVWKEEVV